jgi:hypothetical protein
MPREGGGVMRRTQPSPARSSLVPFALLASVALASTGCAGRDGRIMHNALLLGSLTAAIVLEEERDRRDREPTVIYVNAVGEPAPLPPASSRDRVPDPEPLPAFDGARARSELSSVDVADCREAGVPRGYGHARVSFNPSGEATKVVVDEPSGLSPRAYRCIGDRLGTVTVAPFRGSYVTVGTTWFVP